MHVHLNGRLLPAAEASISVWDGGFLYGDGVYTTLRVYRGRALDLPAHHRRLMDHGRAIDLAMPVDLPALSAIVDALVARNDLARRDGRLRITVSRGGDPEHLLPLDSLDALTPTLLVTLVPVSPELETWQREGVATICLPEEFARGNRPELKSLNCLTNVLALREAARRGCPDALLTGPDGRLLEGAVSNLFLVRDGVVVTPAAEGGFLAGRTRERVLDLLDGLGVDVRAEVLTGADLGRAREGFLASSVREILPLVKIDDRPLGDGRPGPVTRAVQAAYHKKIAADLAGPAA